MKKSTTTADKLRIGFVLDDGLDKPDGVQQYILTLGGWLQSQGHYVRYLVGETKRKDIKEAIILSKNLKVRFNGNSLSTPFPAWPQKVKKILAEERFDVLHVQVPYSPIMAAQAIHFAGGDTNIIGTFHVLPVGGFQTASTKLLGLILKYSLKKFDHFISTSKPTQDFAKKTFGIESEVIGNPVDISKFTDLSDKANKDQGINITFLGRLVPRKGCMELLRAVNELVKKPDLPKITVNICGEGYQRHKLEHYVESSHLTNLVKFHGFVSETEKIKHLAEADFAVFPAFGGESFGIVLIEAMAAKSGVVLAGNNPGYSSVFSDLGDCLFDPFNENDLADKLHNLIKNKPRFDALHKNQQELVKKYEINVIGNRLLEIYRNKV